MCNESIPRTLRGDDGLWTTQEWVEMAEMTIRRTSGYQVTDGLLRLESGATP